MSRGGMAGKNWKPFVPACARFKISSGMLAPAVGLGNCRCNPLAVAGCKDAGTSFVATRTTRPKLSSSSRLSVGALDFGVAADNENATKKNVAGETNPQTKCFKPSP